MFDGGLRGKGGHPWTNYSAQITKAFSGLNVYSSLDNIVKLTYG